jgi:hypothetical protein
LGLGSIPSFLDPNLKLFFKLNHHYTQIFTQYYKPLNKKKIFINNFSIHFSFSSQTCQRDIKRLRERELSLQGDLAAAGKEILRLRDLLKEYMPNASNVPHSMSPM